MNFVDRQNLQARTASAGKKMAMMMNNWNFVAADWRQEEKESDPGWVM